MVKSFAVSCNQDKWVFMLQLEELYIPGKRIICLNILPFSYTFKYIPHKSTWFSRYPLVIKLKFPSHNAIDFKK